MRASDDLVASHAAVAPSPDRDADGDCPISSNVHDVLHEALEQHAEDDPAEIIHDVQCVSESQLMANLDAGAVSPPDLHLLASFAEDGLSSTEEALYDAPHELPSSLYENLFPSDVGGTPPEEPGIASSAPDYPALMPPPSYPAPASASYGLSILERQLTATRSWLPPRTKSAAWGANPRPGPEATTAYAPQYTVLGAPQTPAASEVEESRHFVPSCAFLPSGDTYLVPGYQELLLRQQLIPKSLVFTPAPGYPFAGGCLPMYPMLNQRMAVVGAEMPGEGAPYAAAYGARDPPQPPEGGPGLSNEYTPWAPWPRPQRGARYEDEAQPDTTYGGYHTPAAYTLPSPEAVLPDGPRGPRDDYLSRSPPRYVPPRSGEQYEGDAGYGQNAGAEVMAAQYEPPQPAPPAPRANKEYLVPLTFKEGGQGTLCSICFPSSAPPAARPPPPPPQPEAPGSQPYLAPRKPRQYITVRQMLLERAQKRYLEHEGRTPAPAAREAAPASLPYARLPAPMATNTVTVSYPPLLPAPSTATSYSQPISGMGMMPVSSSMDTSLPPPLYSLSNIAPRPQTPGFFPNLQPAQSSQPRTRAPLRLPEKASSEVTSILRAQLLAPLVIPRNPPPEMPRNLLIPKNWLSGAPVAPRTSTEMRLPAQTTTLPLMPLQKPQLKVSSSYIAVPSTYRLQLPQLFSPTSKTHESGGNSDGTRPPKHYDLETLKIGTFKVEKLNSLRNVNKFKIFFAKRKFAYEFSLENVPLAPNHDAAIPHMAIIDVPFNIVTAIHCNDQEVIIAVCSPPKLFLGCKQNRNGGSMCAGIYFDRDRPTDITNGQLRTSQVHKVCLKRRQAESLRAQLESFDPRFSIILNSPIFEAIAEIEEPTTPICLSPTETAAGGGKRQGDISYQVLPAKKHCILEIITPDVTPKVSATPIVCHCQVSCCSNRCSCMKSKSKCGHTPTGCMCKDCDNPLNMLEAMGLDLEESISDSCLVQGIVSYKGDLNGLMKRKLTFHCCGMPTRVENCIPGKVKCPNEVCNGRSFRFSWCFLELRDEIVNPRNHCSACKACKDPIDLHCQACRKCNPVEGNCTKCPFCGAARSTSFTEQSSVSEVLNRYRQNQQRGFGPASVLGKLAEKVIAIPTDKNDLLNLPKIVERLNEKMREQCVEVSNTDEEENEADNLEGEMAKENNLIIVEEVNIVDSTITLSDVEVVTTQELPETGSPVNVV